MKFGLLLAKDAGGGVTGGGGGRRRRRRLVPGSVVGMAEVGLSAYPLWGGEGNGEGAGGSTPVLASVGVLAVHPDRRGAGIGSDLLVAAEEAVRRWGPVGGGVGAAEVGEREGGNAPAPVPVPVPVLAVHVAVEEGNVSALGFFGGRGYRPVVPDGGGTSESDSDGGGGLRVAVEVAERLGTEVRPHILLRKVLLPPLEGDGDVAEAEGGDYGRKALTG